jgi:O-antigen chain-terminating methyltransferase
MKEDSFYRAFEDRYRGSRELIKERLRVYLPLINPLKDIYGECSVLDLGCGRGEWLDLMGEAGFKAHGVDIDEGMLAACRERGLSVETQDAIAALHQIPDESLMIVSGFHIAEHISFDALQETVKEALRVLKPAGLLILETPNPENLIVGTSSFYLDPTHQRPLPPLLLSFLPEHAGFSRTKILRLQESPDLSSASDVHLLQVLGGVSPDYAVVAQKCAPQERLELFDSAFNVQYGLTLEMLSTRYETGLQARIEQAEAHTTLQSKTDQPELVELRAHLLHAQQSMAQNHALRIQLDGHEAEQDELKKEFVRLQEGIQQNFEMQEQKNLNVTNFMEGYFAQAQSLMSTVHTQQLETMSWLRQVLGEQQERADRLADQLAQAYARGEAKDRESERLVNRIGRLDEALAAAQAERQNHAERAHAMERERNLAVASAEEYRQAVQHWQGVAQQEQHAAEKTKDEAHYWRAESERLHDHQRQIQGQLAQIHAELTARSHELQAVYASRSWRVTRPLRLGVFGLRLLLGRSARQPRVPPTPSPTAAPGQPVQGAAPSAAAPSAMQPPEPIEQRHPLQAEPSSPPMQEAHTQPTTAPAAVTPEFHTEPSRRIYQQLLRARAANKGKGDRS